MDFQLAGYTVSHYDWTVRRSIQVNEYSDGEMTDGYFVGPYDGTVQGRVSYPKFQSHYGTYISIKHGHPEAGSQNALSFEADERGDSEKALRAALSICLGRKIRCIIR